MSDFLDRSIVDGLKAGIRQERAERIAAELAPLYDELTTSDLQSIVDVEVEKADLPRDWANVVLDLIYAQQRGEQ